MKWKMFQSAFKHCQVWIYPSHKHIRIKFSTKPLLETTFWLTLLMSECWSQLIGHRNRPECLPSLSLCKKLTCFYINNSFRQKKVLFLTCVYLFYFYRHPKALSYSSNDAWWTIEKKEEKVFFLSSCIKRDSITLAVSDLFKDAIGIVRLACEKNIFLFDKI